MILTLGIDPGLNKVGYCFLEDGKAVAYPSTVKTPPELPQFLKMTAQREFLARAIEYQTRKFPDGVTYVGIEQPYVPGAGHRGGGGEQSANMWAVYSMMLDVIRGFHLPVVMFNITQLHSLIIRRRGITKTDIVAKAKEENPHFGKVDQHSADAYFVAKNAHAFWLFMDGKIPVLGLEPDQKDIFLSVRTTTKGHKTGTIWRAGDFWFDFRQGQPLTHPIGYQDYIDYLAYNGAERRTNDSP